MHICGVCVCVCLRGGVMWHLCSGAHVWCMCVCVCVYLHGGVMWHLCSGADVGASVVLVLVYLCYSV
jgi:hypothetical protein